MRFLSICSGIGSDAVAWHPLGWETAAFAEIDKHASAVLAHHYPGIPNHGDFTSIEGFEYGPIDLLVGGTPCQSFSVAGLRGGLDDDRGNLALEFCRLADRIRPRWIVWENVPGVLSSNEGRDFASFLGGLALGGYGFAYRVLDAQYVRVESHPRAVPQRRRRVFVVGYLGDWRPPVAVLPEPEGLFGNTPPRREAGEDVAGSLSARATAGGGLGTDFECGGGVVAPPLTHNPYGDHESREGLLVAGTLQASNGGMGNPDRIGELVAGTVSSKWAKGTGGPAGDECYNLVTHFLTAEGHDASEDGTGRGTPIVAFSCKDHGADAGDVSPTLRAMPHDKSHANAGGQVAVGVTVSAQSNGFAWEREFYPAIEAHPASETSDRQKFIRNEMMVRRITPLEAERLMGLPDGYTAIPYNGKPMADGPRYRLLGNGIAINCLRWIGERIALFEKVTA